LQDSCLIETGFAAKSKKLHYTYNGLAQTFVKQFEFNYKMKESIYLHFKYLQALKIATIPLHMQYICLLENNLHLSLGDHSVY
jgi:hypothetical protein